MYTNLKIRRHHHTAADDCYTRNMLNNLPRGLKNIKGEADFTVLFDWLIEREEDWGIDFNLIPGDYPFFRDFVTQLDKMLIQPLGTTDGTTFGRVYYLNDLKRAEQQLQPRRRYREWLKAE